MALDSGILSEFVKVTNDKTTTPSEATLYGTVVESDGRNMVRLDGSNELTPVYSTVVAKPGDRVTVMLKNHTATITGNLSDPSVPAGKVTDLDIIVSHRLSVDEITAFKATFEDLKASIADIGELEAVYAEIETLEARFATIESLNSNEIKALIAQIEKLEADIINSEEISTERLEAAQANIDQLKAYNANFTYVSTEVLNALNANIIKLNVDKLDANFANINYANIDLADIKEFYAETGMIEDITINGLTAVGLAKAVKIQADSIVAGTLTADKLVLLGDDGVYYKLNLNALGIDDDTTLTKEERDAYGTGLHGSAIITESITAEKMSVSDLEAFGAKIAGLTIHNGSIYSGVKDAVNNPTTGLYMDEEGQFAVGDLNQYVKFYKAADGKMKLEIAADAIKFGTGKTVQETVNEAVNSSVGDIQATVDGMREEVDNVNSAIVTMENTMQNQIEGMNTTIGTVQTDVGNVKDSVGSMQTKVETMESTVDGIHTTIGNVQTEVGNVQNEVNNVKETVENTEIGGRNLVEGSTNAWTNLTVGSQGTLTWAVNRMLATDHTIESLGVNVGDSITYSLDLNAINKVLSARLVFKDENNTILEMHDSSDRISAKSSGRSSVTAKVPTDCKFVQLRVLVTGSATSQTTEQYKALKLEKGNVPTDWSPSPKDAEAGVRNYLLDSGPEVILSNAVRRYNFSQDLDWLKSLSGTPITVSFDGKSNTADKNYQIEGSLLVYVGTDLRPQGVVSVTLTPEYKRYTHTFYCPEFTGTILNATQAAYEINGRTSLNTTLNTNGSCSIKNIKFELSTIATDWTVAPEEIERNINTVRDETENIRNFISTLEVDAEGIRASVAAVETQMNEGLEAANSQLESLRERVDVAITADAVTTQVKSILAEDGSSKVVTTTGRFDDDGLTIAKDNSPLSTQITEDGMSVVKDRGTDTEEQMLKADSHGVNATNLHATTYLIVGTEGGRSRFEDYGSNRTGCFWIGG